MGKDPVLKPSRTKATQACEVCRKRKRKCDGVRPACGLCQSLRRPCQYDLFSDKRKPPTSSYVEALKSRISLLEAQLAVSRSRASATTDTASAGVLTSSEHDPTHDSSSPPPSTFAGHLSRASDFIASDMCDVPADSSASAHNLYQAVAQINLHASPEALSALETFSFGRDLNASDDATGLFGYLPYADLSANRFSAAFQKFGPTEAAPPTSRWKNGRNDAEEPPRLRESQELLLFDNFWRWQQEHIPIVVPRLFLSSWHTSLGMRDREEDGRAEAWSDHYFTPLLQDVLLAFGALFFTNPSMPSMLQGAAALAGIHLSYDQSRYGRAAESQEARWRLIGEQFLSRAEKRLASTLMGEPRVADVQALVLMTIWTSGSGMDGVAWSLNGVAVSLSNRLGLHVDPQRLVDQRMMDYDLAFSRFVAFWALVLIDRSHAIFLGQRPMHDIRDIESFTRRQHPCEPPVPDDVGDANEDNPEAEAAARARKIQYDWDNNPPLRLQDEVPRAALQALKTFVVVTDEVINEVYSSDAMSRSCMQDEEVLNKANLRLTSLAQSLPRALALTNALRGEHIALIYVHLQFHLAVILTNRPFLSKYLARASTVSPPNGAISSPLGPHLRLCQTAISRCVESATIIVSLLALVSPHSPCFTIPPITFTACTILLLCATPRNNPTRRRAALKGLKVCLLVLRRAAWSWPSAENKRRAVVGLAKRWGVKLDLGEEDETVKAEVEDSSFETTASTLNSFATRADKTQESSSSELASSTSNVYGSSTAGASGLEGLSGRGVDSGLDADATLFDGPRLGGFYSAASANPSASATEYFPAQNAGDATRPAAESFNPNSWSAAVHPEPPGAQYAGAVAVSMDFDPALAADFDFDVSYDALRGVDWDLNVPWDPDVPTTVWPYGSVGGEN